MCVCGGGGGGGSASLRSTNSRPYFCFGYSDTLLFGLCGRFLAHRCISLETQKSKINLR